jgi:hypothetical protein
MNTPLDFDEKIFALQMYDRVAIVADLIMEHWLEGNANPPQALISAYYDAVEGAQIAINGNRLHEQVVRPNAEFYEKLHEKFGLTENKKKNQQSVGSTPTRAITGCPYSRHPTRKGEQVG